MRKQKPLRPYERPMAYPRVVTALVLVIAALVLVRVLTSKDNPLAKLSAQQLATSMGTALLHVHSMTFTIASQINNQGQTVALGGSLSVQQNGNFEISGQSEQDPAQMGEIRFVDGRLYFHYSKSAIYHIMRLVPQRVSDHGARVASKALGGHWFTTGYVATNVGPAPATPSSASKLFSALGYSDESTFIKQAPTTNQGVSVVPLVTGNVTWFIPVTGPRLPDAVTAPSATQSDPFSFLLSYAYAQISYAPVSISTPTHLAHVPDGFAREWNEVLPAQRISKLTPYGLLRLALVSAS